MKLNAIYSLTFEKPEISFHLPLMEISPFFSSILSQISLDAFIFFSHSPFPLTLQRDVHCSLKPMLPTDETTTKYRVKQGPFNSYEQKYLQYASINMFAQISYLPMQGQCDCSLKTIKHFVLFIIAIILFSKLCTLHLDMLNSFVLLNNWKILFVQHLS